MIRVILLVVAFMASAATASDKVWMVVTISDNGGRGEYNGMIERSIYDQFLAGTYKGSFLTLEEPFYFDAAANIMFLDELENEGRSYGYQGPLHLRVDSIVRFGLMDGDMVQARIEEKRLGVRPRPKDCSSK